MENKSGSAGAAILGFYGAIVCCRKYGVLPSDMFNLVYKECFMFEPGQMVKFKSTKNARGYPLTGEVRSVDDMDSLAMTVMCWGLYGPGTETVVHGVTPEDVEKIADPS